MTGILRHGRMAAILCCPLIFFSSCGTSQDGAAGEEGSKLVYSAPENVVSVSPLVKQDFKVQLISNGRLCAARRATLYFAQSGIIKDINAGNGQGVRQGAVIAELADEQARLKLKAARLAMDKAELDLYDVLAGLGYASKDTAAVPAEVLSVAKLRSGFLSAAIELEKAMSELSQTRLVAPFAGRIADMKLKTADAASAGEAFCTLIGDSMMDVEFSVLESDFPILSQGLPVRVIPFGRTGVELQGRIKSINPTVGKNGQVSVWASVGNDGSLIDGMNVKVIVEKSVGEMLVVPRSAVVIRDNLDVLFRYNGGRADWVYVNILNSNSDSFAVEANKDRGAVLGEGDSIIVSGNLNLADGSAVVLKQ